jgi:hypothetical protein
MSLSAVIDEVAKTELKFRQNSLPVSGVTGALVGRLFCSNERVAFEAKVNI